MREKKEFKCFIKIETLNHIIKQIPNIEKENGSVFLFYQTETLKKKY